MFGDFWSNVTGPQATILAAALTVIAADFGVSLGAYLFGNRVKDLKGALDTSDTLLRDHVSAATRGFENIESQLRSLDVLSRTTTAGIGQLRSDVGEIGDAQTAANVSNAATVADLSSQIQ